ncbi:ATP-binding protein [Kocuria sp. NPDC057446]|uniref:ATP-binding protein n=1 Tax=Kocuria sp. NPDC057446 TaxID=3346137 RepID=UPI0036B204A5
MAEEPRTCSRRGPATAATIEAVHDDIDSLWSEADDVPQVDRMAFTLAVVEVATNVVAHAVPSAGAPLELQVDVTAAPCRLQARVYEIGAAPSGVDAGADPGVDELAESGRGLALVRALVSTVVFERHGDTNVWELRREYHGEGP